MRSRGVLAGLVLALGAATTAAAADEPVSYNGWKVFRVETPIDDAEALEALGKLNTVVEDDHGAPGQLQVAIAPESLDDFAKLGYRSTIVQEDLGADITAERIPGPYRRSKRQAGASALPDASWWDSFHPYDDHRGFFEDLQAAFPDNSEIVTAGKSHEGRDIYAFHFWGKDGKGAKPVVAWHATTHAREWIAAPTVEYITWQLVKGYLDKDDEAKKLVDKFDYYVIPFVNADGFIYSWTVDRLWRKNRQPRPGTECIGTDINRNWAAYWSLPGGASDDPCSLTYRGLAAADTPEASSLSNWTDAALLDKNKIRLYVDFHSYGQYALQPYGYSNSSDAVPPNFAKQIEVARGYVDEVASVNGTRYVYGASGRTLYITTGSAPDWFSDQAGAEFSWTIELRPQDAAAGGFVVSTSLIRPNVEEQWEGLKYVLSKV